MACLRRTTRKPRGRYTARRLKRLPIARFRRYISQSTNPEMVASRCKFQAGDAGPGIEGMATRQRRR
jgi:hypothetical protein